MPLEERVFLVCSLRGGAGGGEGERDPTSSKEAN